MKTRRDNPSGMTPGLGVDAFGGSVVDPTQNVKDLMEASIKGLTAEALLREQLANEKILRMEREWTHQEQMALLRANHAQELRVMETNRIDSIRQVDVLAVNTAADRALAAIQTLAKTTADNAENLRNALNTTAQTIATQTASTVSAITERISALEKTSYTGQGRQAYADPMLTELTAELRRLGTVRDVGTGKSEGLSMSVAIVMGAITIVFGIIGAAATIYAVLKP